MSKRTLENLETGRGLRHLAARPCLVICIPIVALSYFMLPATWHGTTRLLIAWNIGTWPYIVLTVRAMARANEASIRRQALMGDQSRFVVLIPTRVKADSFQGFQNGASSESCPSAS